MRNYFIKTVMAGLWIGLLVTSISAQNFLCQPLPQSKPQLGFRFMRPNFEWDADLSLLSGTYDLYVNIPVTSKFNLVGSLPFTTFSAKDEDSESGIGNIYIGFQTRPASEFGNNSSLSMGLFLPTAKDEFTPMILGLYSNYYEIQKYVPDLLTVYGNYAYSLNQPRGTVFGLEIGPSVFIPTKDDGQTELFAHYGIWGGFKLTYMALSAELTGLAIISEDVENFEDRFVHSLAFGAQWIGSTVKPGIFYEIYLKEDFRDVVDGVLGIKVDVTLP